MWARARDKCGWTKRAMRGGKIRVLFYNLYEILINNNNIYFRYDSIVFYVMRKILALYWKTIYDSIGLLQGAKQSRIWLMCHCMYNFEWIFFLVWWNAST